MSNHAKNFENRKVGAEETARWLLPEFHRAQDLGESEVVVKVRDLGEILAYIEAVRYREKAEFSGKLLGFASGEEMRQMLSRERPSMGVCGRKSSRKDVAVYFLELPKKAPKEAADG